ncbi:NAD(P)/FAD-dependent oxidoreductase [Seohaeicola zhoushanensis]|uniref:NAD(P)/FAD-dependent oxidoreductase n=1 Tax=Seohaeicola zhoushanensis TaxID=1569283 RepID=UPI0016764835|nr:FAD-binding oxidoreductase [Seohaeicola zhoushanensis]
MHRTGLKVAVIGGGVVGLSTALWLQRSGHQVVVIDPAPPLPGIGFRGAASFGNAATIAPSGIFPVASPGILWRVPGMMLDREGPLSLYWADLPDLLPWLTAFVLASGMKKFDRLTSELSGLMRLVESGHAPLMAEADCVQPRRGEGSIHLYRSTAEMDGVRPALARRNHEGIRARLLSRDEIRAMEPNLAEDYAGGAIFEDCYILDSPEDYCRELARAIQRRGGQFVQARCKGVDSTTDGVSVRTSGRAVTADRAVIAAGAWSRRIARASGQRLNMNTERGYHVAFAPHAGLLNHAVMYPSDGFFLTPLDHQIRAAGTVELGGLDKPAREVRLRVLEAKARRMVPALGERQDQWLGFRPSSPDSKPFIGPSARDPRILFACGHGHMGVTLAGITGLLISQVVDGKTPMLDLAPFSPGRPLMRI